jgi:hypothetical protein
MPMQQVDLVVIKIVTGAYEARSYPDQQTDATGCYRLYSVPIYKIPFPRRLPHPCDFGDAGCPVSHARCEKRA